MTFTPTHQQYSLNFKFSMIFSRRAAAEREKAGAKRLLTVAKLKFYLQQRVISC